jgi:dTDP-4-dehydrorhamnose reductase
MKALIVGSAGQLGRALQATAPIGTEITALTRGDLDVTDADAVMRMVEVNQPDVIFNAAAYTAVDKAESEPEQARGVNATAVAHLVAAANVAGATLVQVSTDFVFDGQSARAYKPDDSAHPISIYGQTKYEGEQAIGKEALIVRTGWVYATTGHNFVRTMLRLMGEREELRIVCDQIGTPTYAPGLASTLWALVAHGAQGIWHHSDAGTASWYDFAVAIQEEAVALGLLRQTARLVPIATADYFTPARRPIFSVLDKSKTWSALNQISPHWRVNLRAMLKDVHTHG